MMQPYLDRVQVARAADAIAPYVRRTPLLEIDGEDAGVPGVAVALKLESMQVAGSFKARGAFANLLLRPVPAAGVVAASGGNHGVAVAYAAMKLGIPAKIFVPVVSSKPKVERIRAYGAGLVVAGERYADALAGAQEWAARTGAMDVHAFDQDETLLGTATIGREIDEQSAAFDTVLVAVGGGGLMGGIAAWYGGTTRAIAVEPEGAPTLFEAMKAGRPVDAPAGSIANDSLAPRRVGDLMFPVAQRFVHGVVLVSDDDIRDAQRRLWSSVGVVAEPGGAAAFAALLKARYVPEPGERVVCLVSGSNYAIDVP
jgi:threonine dehydratase